MLTQPLMHFQSTIKNKLKSKQAQNDTVKQRQRREQKLLDNLLPQNPVDAEANQTSLSQRTHN